MRRSKRLTVIDAAWIEFCLLVLLLVAIPAFAAARPVTFCDVCRGYMISKKGDDVLIRCPDGSIWMTIKNCKNPRATRGADKVTINCDFPSQ